MKATRATRRAALAAISATLLFSPAVQAHVDGSGQNAFLGYWPFSPDAAVALLVAALLYTRGIRRMRDKSEAAHRGRHLAFYAGLAAIFLALLTPVDAISEHVFAVHQIQHLLLRGVAPMLLMLAVPSAPLIAGMPAGLRHRILAPALAHRGVRAVFRFLARPLVCTVLYVGALYVWQVPAIHDAALLHKGWHYLMHVTMLASGLLFFWTVFDPRPAPWGTAFPQRLTMLGAAIFANIPLGAVITLKDTASYAAYDQIGRWWGVEPLADELLGGIVIWALASMMGLFAVLLLVRLWGRAEHRRDQRRRQGFALPLGVDADASGTGPAAFAARRRLAWKLALVPLTVLVAVVATALWVSWHRKALPQLVALTAPTTALSMARARPRVVDRSWSIRGESADGTASRRSAAEQRGSNR